MKITAEELDLREIKALALRKSADSELEEIERQRAALSKASKGMGKRKKQEEQKKADLMSHLISKRLGKTSVGKTG